MTKSSVVDVGKGFEYTSAFGVTLLCLTVGGW